MSTEHYQNIENMSEWANLYESGKKSGKLKKIQKTIKIENQNTAEMYNLSGIGVPITNESKISNPIHPDSVGKDQSNPEPAWVSEDMIKEIEKLKQKLFDLENKLAAEHGGNGKVVDKCHHPKDEEILSKMDKIKKDIDKVSNSLGVKDKETSWEVKDEEK